MPTHLVRAALVVPLAVLAVLAPATSTVAPDTDPGPHRTPAPASQPEASAGYRPPVPGAVVHPFDPPAERWAAGHRGVDLAARVGEPVAAPGPGLVTFAGQVGGKRTVVVTHPDGLRSTLEPVVATVERGSTVAAGQVVGMVTTAPATADNPGHCAPDDCLHWGVRRGDVYLDPLELLGISPPIVLLPLDG